MEFVIEKFNDNTISRFDKFYARYSHEKDCSHHRDNSSHDKLT